MNSFTDGKPLDQGTGGGAPVIVTRPKTTPRYGLFAILAGLALLIFIIYQLQMTKSQLKEFQTSQTAKSAALEEKLVGRLNENEKSLDSLHSDFKVLQDKLGVTQRELDTARAIAQKARADNEQTVQQLNQQLSKKADAQQLSAFKEEASSKLGAVNKDVTAVKSDVEATRKELEGTRRDLTDVKDTLSQQIARNRDELQQLRLKGERNYYEFAIDQKKKVVLVGDIRVMLLDANPKKKTYGVRIVVDDNQLEKKNRSLNESIQFLVGKTKLRYELVVNEVKKDSISGYLSVPKDKALGAERG
jgi:chromosome segregation ATPase